ncbi:hypothetical protein PV11_06344 [Exophiala sideris]|uniref:JmjC domain-containing protein n=1 Tax=Exophiala sideris TaxID=1016849 RepID=A0A0D1Y773_9EURO|nr:hypothetical protein PV11_06344 [Exophiala sideris]
MLQFKDQFWQSIAEHMQDEDANDPICECYAGGLGELIEEADELLNLADQKLHVFPFKDVRPCWFRLYTDASIAQVLKLVHSIEKPNKVFTFSQSLHKNIGVIVHRLDMSLIMAGGMGREDVIQQILEHLKSLSQLQKLEAVRPAKRRRLEKPATDDHPQLDMLPNECISLPKLQFPVQHMNQPGLATFQKYMQDERKPVVLTGILGHWPAIERWKRTSYWLDRTLNGHRLVPIEIGRSYTDDDWGQTIVPFRTFLNDYILRGNQARTVPAEDMKTGYLAQHDLLKQIPALRSDIATPDYCFLDAPPAESGTPVALAKAKGPANKTSHPSMIPTVASSLPSNSNNDDDAGATDLDTDVQTNIWFGPSWTISPLHHDPYHNILCQVVGKKYVRLYSPHNSTSLFPRCKDEPAPHLSELQNGLSASDKTSETISAGETIDMSNTSQIDVAAMELSPQEDWDEVYPGISTVPYVECILEAGQALYIPIGWWHYVRSCSVGISVSFWW